MATQVPNPLAVQEQPPLSSIAHDNAEDDLGLTDQTNRLPPLRVALIFFALGVSLLLSVLEASIVSTSLSTISSSLHGGSNSSWIVTSFMLAQCALSPCWSRLSDILGRKVLLNFCLILFLVASLGCALAQNMSTMLAFRVFQGIGGGALLVLAQAICLDIVTLRERSKYQIIFEIVVTVGNGFGPILGGVFAAYNWRWCFYINLPLGAVALLLCFFLIPVVPVTGSWRLKLKQIDFMGCALISTSAVLILLGLSWGGVTYSWSSAPVIVVFVLGVFILAGFCVWESRGANIPVLPMRMFRIPTVVGVAVLTFMSSGMNTKITIFSIPQFLQLVKGYSTVKSGVLLVPFLVPITIFVGTCAMITSKTGRSRESLFVGLMLNAVSLGLISTLDESSNVAHIVGYLIFGGSSVGFTLQTALISAQAAVRKSELTVVTGLRIFMRYLGGVCGVAVASALINNQLHGAPVSAAVLREILETPSLLHSSSHNLDENTITIILNHYKDGFRRVFLFAAISGAVAFVVAALTVKHYDLAEDPVVVPLKDTNKPVAAAASPKVEV
ncbi:MFS general substrate transporter [Meredithblackwellia eburnea MCA 4105]